MKDLFYFISDTDENNKNPFILRELDGELKQRVNARGKVFGKQFYWQLISIVLCFALLIIGVTASVVVFFEWLPNREVDYAGTYLAIASLGLVIILFVIRKLSLALFLRSKKVKIIEAEREEVNKQIKAVLHIPENAVEIDVLRSFESVSRKGSPKTVYWNEQVSVFVEGNNLCFADFDVVFGVPLSAFKTVLRVTDKVYIKDWDRQLLENNPKYLPYARKRHKIEVDEIFSVQFTYLNEQWQFFIPVYELETIKRFIGINPNN